MKSFEKKHVKGTKIFLKNKEKKGKKRSKTDIKIFLNKKKRKKSQYHRERNKNLSEEEKEEKVEYMTNYLSHRKNLVGDLWVFRVLGQIKKKKFYSKKPPNL